MLDTSSTSSCQWKSTAALVASSPAAATGLRIVIPKSSDTPLASTSVTSREALETNLGATTPATGLCHDFPLPSCAAAGYAHAYEPNFTATLQRLNTHKSALALLGADLSQHALHDAIKDSKDANPPLILVASVSSVSQPKLSTTPSNFHTACGDFLQDVPFSASTHDALPPEVLGTSGVGGKRPKAVAADDVLSVPEPSTIGTVPTLPTEEQRRTARSKDLEIGMDVVLQDAAQVRGIRLLWLLYLIAFIVLLLFVLMLVQLAYTTQKTISASGKRIIVSTAVSTVTNLELLLADLEELFAQMYRIMKGNSGSSPPMREDLCPRLYGAPAAIGQYTVASVLQWQLTCHAVANVSLPPTMMLFTWHVTAGGVGLARFSDNHLLAYLYDETTQALSVVVLDKNIVGRSLFSNSLVDDSTGTLQSFAGLMLPSLTDPGPQVVLHSLTRETPSYKASQPTTLGAALQKIYHDICIPGPESVWNTVLDTKRDTNVPGGSFNATASPIPVPYVERGGAWRLTSRMSMCAVLCRDDETPRCSSANPSSMWVSLSADLSELRNDQALNAFGSLAIIAVVVFLVTVTIVYLGIAIPISFIQRQLMRMMGSHDQPHDCYRRGLLLRWTHCLWLGDLTALALTVHVLGLCYRLNQKYVPDHVRQSYAKELYYHRGDLKVLHDWMPSASEDDESDEEMLPNSFLHRSLPYDGRTPFELSGVMSASTGRPCVPSFEEEPPALGTMDVKETVVSKNGSGAAHLHNTEEVPSMGPSGWADLDGSIAVVDMEGSYAAPLPGIAKTHMEVKRSEEATILCVNLCDMDNAYLINYPIAIKQHRRCMKFLLSRIRKHRGVVFHRSGDCLAAAWNAFNGCGRHAEHAAVCAQEIAIAFARYRQAGLQMGIVLHQGLFVCGTVDDKKEAFATAFGEGPRQALALADLAASLPSFNILVTESAKRALSAKYECTIVDVIGMPDGGHPLIVFDLGAPCQAVPGGPASPKNSDAAVQYAKIFSQFRLHEFKAALDGIRTMRRQHPTWASMQLLRLEHLCHCAQGNPSFLPLPYSRRYPTWTIYENFAQMDAVEDVNALSSITTPPDQFLLPAVLYTKVPHVDDDMLNFKQELHDNVRRIGSPAQCQAKPTETGRHTTEAFDTPLRPSPPVLCTTQPFSSLNPRHVPLPLLIVATADVNGGAHAASVSHTAHEASVTNSECIAKLPHHARRGGSASDITTSQPCFSFTQHANSHLPLLPIKGRGEALGTSTGGSFMDHDGTFRSASFAAEMQLEVEIAAKNGNTYLRSARVLGSGSFGSVYLGMDVHSGRLVAIKFLPLPGDESEVDGIEAEVLIMQRVKDFHIVEFISYAFQGDFIVIIMECMMAGSLQNMITSFKIIPSATARLFMRDVLRGVRSLHSMGVVHRDVKPQNVLLTMAGTCKISDFGASAWLHDIARKEAVGLVFGTPVYLAPEAARGKPEEGSDIWSCGVMYIQLVTGSLPYTRAQLELPPGILVFHIGSGLAVPTVPEHLDELDREFVVACLQKDPSERKTASELLQMALFSL